METNQDTICTPCQEDFERNIDRLVEEGQTPSGREHEEKKHEVDAAFSGSEHPNK